MSKHIHISPIEELAEFLARGPTPAEIANFHLSPVAIARARELLDKCKAGTLTAEGERELDRMILLDDIIGLIRSRVPASETSQSTIEVPDHGPLGMDNETA